ncbi:hypothetical protein [Geomicrobium sediminis]|uniref:Uncharacterized protein n=1 Tax=Geomicrobium sediminis TaxID=1347788 RepID=A0ABS2P7A5_9BACL|nr:hypothetical protein [Geomicrobium sediminis]MBM7631197.1 hypothetical protein [Geomicrobium sediminis]
MAKVQLSHFRNGLTPPITAIANHLNYIEHKEPQQRFFGKSLTDRRAFVQKIDRQTSAIEPAFRLQISFSYLELDFKQVIQAAMWRLERQLRIDFDWIAMVHCESNDPHVHVIIRGCDLHGELLIFYPSYVLQLKKQIEAIENEQLRNEEKEREIASYLINISRN